MAYSEPAADFLLSLKRARLASLLYDLRCLASDPFVRSDYRLEDEQGRQIEHVYKCRLTSGNELIMVALSGPLSTFTNAAILQIELNLLELA